MKTIIRKDYGRVWHNKYKGEDQGQGSRKEERIINDETEKILGEINKRQEMKQ
jgi:hypothetical protein